MKNLYKTGDYVSVSVKEIFTVEGVVITVLARPDFYYFVKIIKPTEHKGKVILAPECAVKFLSSSEDKPKELITSKNPEIKEGVKFFVNTLYSSEFGENLRNVIPDGPCVITKIEPVMCLNMDNVNIIHFSKLNGAECVVSEPMFLELVNKKIISFVEEDKRKERREWSPWRTYTKTFLTPDGERDFTFSVRTNKKRTVCITHVVDENNVTRKIMGATSCNQKAGDIFSVEFGFHLATARCEKKLADWLKESMRKRIVAQQELAENIQFQADAFAKQKESLKSTEGYGILK